MTRAPRRRAASSTASDAKCRRRRLRTGAKVGAHFRTGKQGEQAFHELDVQRVVQRHELRLGGLVARGFVDLGRKRQHRVRILAKRLRYALDLLAPTLARPRQAADYVEALAELQDSLGELNDAAVARERLGQLAPSRAQARTLARRIATTEDAMAARAGRQLDALTRRPRPWRPA